eukprot:TRINITY_DN12537_c0_g1_i1.p3 TRINITY_DN12537_c0_g1~~TRINITY_DN12537_c0_g1_i1.p3  ORF type:complete len:217 (-),score=56.48 TRINITY_DN12537_c0_g1_i1:369-1019(-)
MWHDDVETDAKKTWGRALFVCLIVFMMLFAILLLVPLCFLLHFQLQLIWRSAQSGRPETTYMFTVDRNHQLRTINAYLDVAFLNKFKHLVLLLHIDAKIGLYLWRENAKTLKDLREKESFSGGMGAVRRRMLAFQGTGPQFSTPEPDSEDSDAAAASQMIPHAEDRSATFGENSEIQPLMAPALEEVPRGNRGEQGGQNKSGWWCCPLKKKKPSVL